MSLYKEQLTKGGGKYGGRRSVNRAGWRAWAKNQISRLLRRQGKKSLDDAPTKPSFQGYE